LKTTGRQGAAAALRIAGEARRIRQRLRQNTSSIEGRQGWPVDIGLVVDVHRWLLACRIKIRQSASYRFV
jgi:hypothetical protein